MKIYLDLVVILNFLVDFLLLLGTNRLSGFPASPLRAAAAAALGALLATAADVAALKKPFGVFLLVAGLYTVFSKIPGED